jgi:hypothetical protein
MTKTLGRLLLGAALLLAGVGGATPVTVFAQNAAPAGGTAPAPSSGVVTTTVSRPIVEYAMVIVMFGAALFAVCRSSRRNA